MGYKTICRVMDVELWMILDPWTDPNKIIFTSSSITFHK